jgi:hypothetical protein
MTLPKPMVTKNTKLKYIKKLAFISPYYIYNKPQNESKMQYESLITPHEESEVLVLVKDEESLRSFPGINILHVCDDTYLVNGNDDFITHLLKKKFCLDSTPCLYPKSLWKREYRYLGDIPINLGFNFDLRLAKGVDAKYFLNAQLPSGVHFTNGFLHGVCTEQTTIINLNIVAELKNDIKSTCFQIRFFDGVNHAKSFTDKNYLKFGYGRQLQDYDTSKPYFRFFERAQNALSTPFNEAKRAALKIQYEANEKAIFLFVSGGIDSQCMVQSFQAANVPFKAILMVDTGGSNKADVFYAKKFFEEARLPLQTYELSYASFIKDYRYVDLANHYRFNNPEYGILLHLMEKFKGFPVYAGRPISTSFHESGKQVIGLAGDETWSRARYLERNNLTGCPEFLIYTSELLESFLQMPSIRQFSKNDSWIYPHKLRLLNEAGFNISCAPPIKHTGFETLQSQFAETNLGNEMWLHHRAPLKIRYPHGPWRNAVSIDESSDEILKNILLKSYEDGFSKRYMAKNKIADFH